MKIIQRAGIILSLFFFLNQIHILESHWDPFLKQLFAVSEH